MKYILILAITLIATSVSAQVTQKPGNKMKRTNGAKKEIPPPLVGPGYQTLNQDNMPCLVPDMTQLAPMPNSIKANQKIQFIPNGYQNTSVVVVEKNNTSKRLPK